MSKPIKRFKTTRHRDGRITVKALHDSQVGDYSQGDSVIGFESDVNIEVSIRDLQAHHGVMASYFNAVMNHQDGRMTDEEFLKFCAHLMEVQLNAHIEGWNLYVEAGELEPHNKEERAKLRHAKQLHKRLRKANLRVPK